MYLFFDTETTGLPRNWKAPVTDLNNWPRMVQIAWILSDSFNKELRIMVIMASPTKIYSEGIMPMTFIPTINKIPDICPTRRIGNFV